MNFVHKGIYDIACKNIIILHKDGTLMKSLERHHIWPDSIRVLFAFQKNNRSENVCIKFASA